MNPFSLSLYLHVPFCRSKCAYCDFPSKPLGLCPAEQPERFARTALERGKRILERLASERGGLRLDTVFIGGGTPSVLPAPVIESLLSGIQSFTREYPGLREWTVECNPESLRPFHLELFGAHGVNRISLGVQSLEEEALKQAGRPCGTADAYRALSLLSGSWKGRWSVDLMVGLPGQSGEGPSRDAATCASAGAGHVSLYSLILEDGTALAERAAREPRCLPDQDAAADSWDAAAESLGRLGYARYEISNFARKEQECLHNLHYWRLDPWIGLGPSAVSTLPVGGGRSLRWKEAVDIDAWLSGEEAEREGIDRVDNAKEWLLMGLRTAKGIHPGEILSRFHLDGQARLQLLFDQWTGKGLAERDGEDGAFSLTGKGMDLMDGLLVDAFSLLDSLGGAGEA